MCNPKRVCFSDDVDSYDPKLKVDRSTGLWKQGVAYQYGPSSYSSWRRLLVIGALTVVASFASLHHHQDKTAAKFLAVKPATRPLLRKETTPRRLSSSSVVAPPLPLPPLVIQNLPKSLAWKKGKKKPRNSEIKVLPVDVGYYFNPSILELANGRHVFALRMGWLYGSGCDKIFAAAEASPSSDVLVESVFHCFKHHKERFVDQTLLGEFDPLSHALVVHDQGHAPSSLLPSGGVATGVLARTLGLSPSKTIQDFDFATSWDAGAFWHDTRLLHPFNERPMPGLDKILLTSQNIEILGRNDWKALDYDANLVLHLTYITAVDPSRILDPVSMNQQKMTRWLYYDAELERQEWDRRQRGESKWQLSSFDVARLKCHQRPPGLPALPFDPDELSKKSAFERVQRRRLYDRKVDDSWSFIKDKNWSPFAYKGKVLWSYKLEPHHVVCENDVDLTQEGVQDREDLDCVLCLTKYNSSSSDVFDGLYQDLRQQGYDDVVAHLNGAPAYHVPDKNLYLGLMHVIKVNRTSDQLGWEKRTRTYEHYFYALEAAPPFRVAAVATVRVALERSLGWSHWFDIDEVATVEFVMYMQFHPDRPGREIVISYGDGDRMARIATLALDDVWASFDFVSSDS